MHDCCIDREYRLCLFPYLIIIIISSYIFNFEYLWMLCLLKKSIDCMHHCIMQPFLNLKIVKILQLLGVAPQTPEILSYTMAIQYYNASWPPQHVRSRIATVPMLSVHACTNVTKFWKITLMGTYCTFSSEKQLENFVFCSFMASIQ